MELIKTKIMSVSKDRERRVYKSKTHYRKYWNYSSHTFGPQGMSIKEHVEMVNKLFPGYILTYGTTSNRHGKTHVIVVTESSMKRSHKSLQPKFFFKLFTTESF